MTDLSRRINDFLKPYMEREPVLPGNMTALALLKEAVEALAARDAQISANAAVAEDRDAAWRFARAAADGHDHNRQVLADIARVFGRVDDWDTLPASVSQLSIEVGTQRVEAGRAYAERDATARLLDDARREADQIRTLAVELNCALRDVLATHKAAVDRIELAIALVNPGPKPPVSGP